MRRLPAILMAATVLAALPAVPAAAATAPVAAVQVQLADPLMTDPVQLQVTATDAGGDAVPFTGVVTLTTGRTSTTATVTGDGSGAAEVDLATDALSGGAADAHAVVHGGGGSAVTTVAAITQVPVALAIGGFGCAALTAKGGDVPFAVTAMNGEPVIHPAATSTWEMPYVTVSAGPTRMVDADGAPLTTSGRLTIRSGSRVIAALAVPAAVRPLVFGVHWSARVRGRFTPGRVTATLALTDPRGRTVTATRTVFLVRSGTQPCA